MKRFQQSELRAAYAYTAAGGQALHTHRIIGNRSRAPYCFIRAIDNGEDIAHLFDQDQQRLVRTVRSLGVKVVLVECKLQLEQHVDLCGAPLRRAIAQCESCGSEK